MGETKRHPTVGRKFRAFGAVYRCTSWDRSCGFWMEMVGGKDELFGRHAGARVNVSEAAIGRTYHRVYDDGTYARHDNGCNCAVCEPPA